MHTTHTPTDIENMPADARAITVRHPWAECIANGTKTVENRSAGTRWRGTLYIHAATTHAAYGDDDPRVSHALRGRRGILDYGVIIAVADLVDVHTARPVPALLGELGVCCEPWGESTHSGRRARHLVLSNIRRLSMPVPATGALGIWTPDPDVVHKVLHELAQPA